MFLHADWQLLDHVSVVAVFVPNAIIYEGNFVKIPGKCG